MLLLLRQPKGAILIQITNKARVIRQANLKLFVCTTDAHLIIATFFPRLHVTAT